MKEKKDINIEIGLRVKQEREKAGLTQARLAELLDMGTKSISAIERGEVGVSLTSLQNICRALSISSDRLMFGSETKNDAQDLIERLEGLTPVQFEIAVDILNKLIEAFAISH